MHKTSTQTGCAKGCCFLRAVLCFCGSAAGSTAALCLLGSALLCSCQVRADIAPGRSSAPTVLPTIRLQNAALMFFWTQ